MATVDREIYRISDSISNLNPGQIGVQDAVDTDLGFRMYGGQAWDSTETLWLAKDKPAFLESLKCSEDLWLGDSKESRLLLDTNQTPDSLMWGMPATSNALMICRMADIGTDFALSLHANPTLIMKSSDTTAANRTEFSHSLIRTFAGSMSIHANNLIFDSDSGSLTFTGGINTGLAIFGHDHTVNSQYTYDSAIFGDSHNVNASHGLTAGNTNINTGYAAIVGGTATYCTGRRNVCVGEDLTSHGDETAMFGKNNTGSSAAQCSVIGGEGVIATCSHSCVVGSAITAGGSYNAAFGGGHDLGVGNHNIVGGEDGIITGEYSIVHGDTLTVGADYSAVFGAGTNVASGCDYGIVAGTAHDVDTADFYAVVGTGHDVNASYGFVFGATNEVDHDHAMVHGSFAKSYWSNGRFFASVRLDGSTTGISQGMDSTVLARHTESTSAVMLTTDGTGTTSPLYIEEGSFQSFYLSVLASYEDNAGYLSRLYHISVYNSPSSGMAVAANTLDTLVNGGSTFSIGFVVDDTDETLEIMVTPSSATAANIHAHIFGGNKVKGQAS